MSICEACHTECGGHCNNPCRSNSKIALRVLAILKEFRDAENAKFGDSSRTCVQVLVNGYNWATSPSRSMYEREHNTCKKLAALLMKRLKKFGGWKKSEDGYLIC